MVHSLKILISVLYIEVHENMPGSGRVWSLFCPGTRFFGKIFPSLNFTLTAHPYRPLFIGSQPTRLCVNVLFIIL